MTKFETMDNMNTNFVTLSENELTDVDGGIAPVVIAFGVAAFKGFTATGGAIMLAAGLYKVGQSLK